MEEASFYAIQIANAPYFFSRQNYNNSKSRLYRKNLSPSLPHLYISSKCIIFYTIVEINRNKSLDFSTYVKFWFSISSFLLSLYKKKYSTIMHIFSKNSSSIFLKFWGQLFTKKFPKLIKLPKKGKNVVSKLCGKIPSIWFLQNRIIIPVYFMQPSFTRKGQINCKRVVGSKERPCTSFWFSLFYREFIFLWVNSLY